MKHIEPSKFHPTFSLPSPQWHTLLLPLFKYERTAFGFSTPVPPFFLIVCYLPFAFIYSFFYTSVFWTKGGMHFSKVHWLDSFRIWDRISIRRSSCYITNIHKTCFTIKMWSLFVRIKRLRYSSSLLHSFEYPRVENRTSVDCGKLFNKRLPSKHVNIRNWGAMSQQKRNDIIHCIYIRIMLSKRFS